MRRWPLWVIFSASIAAPSVLAHGPVRPPSIAEFRNPTGVGEIADEVYTFTWNDGDMAPKTSTTTIDFYYTPTIPPTFVPGTLPPIPNSHLIQADIRLNDPSNVLSWDTRNIPAGTYWLWSRTTEIPVSNPQKIITFSQGVVAIAHPGDPIGPAVIIAPRDDQFHWPEAYSVEIRYWTFDPTHNAKVKLEVTRGDGTMQVLADDLPAVAKGSFTWDTTNYAEGQWTIRATIHDDRGMTFQAYDRYFWEVNHPKHESGGCRCVVTSRGRW